MFSVHWPYLQRLESLGVTVVCRKPSSVWKVWGISCNYPYLICLLLVKFGLWHLNDIKLLRNSSTLEILLPNDKGWCKSFVVQSNRVNGQEVTIWLNEILFPFKKKWVGVKFSSSFEESIWCLLLISTWNSEVCITIFSFLIDLNISRWNHETSFDH